MAAAQPITVSNGGNVTPFPSDLTLNARKTIGPPPPVALATMRKMIALQQSTPKWWEVGAARYREMRERGETTIPPPIHLPDSEDIALPSRDSDRTISCRHIFPDNAGASSPPRGIYLHIHGGGWVLQSEKGADPHLKRVANATGLRVVSVGYRLAPEHPFPAAPNDCFDVAEYLIDHAASKFGTGAELMLIGGESAGAHLSLLTLLHLLQSRPQFRFRGAVLAYGIYNLSIPFPSNNQFKLPLSIPRATIDHFLEAFTPGMSAVERANPNISPFWHPIWDLEEAEIEGKGKEGLPPALILVGTADPLVDDSVFLAAKWQMAGQEAVLRLFRGLPHGFNAQGDAVMPGSEEAVQLQTDWMRSKLVGAQGRE